MNKIIRNLFIKTMSKIRNLSNVKTVLYVNTYIYKLKVWIYTTNLVIHTKKHRNIHQSEKEL